jgi:hypothetical protein
MGGRSGAGDLETDASPREPSWARPGGLWLLPRNANGKISRAELRQQLETPG